MWLGIRIRGLQLEMLQILCQKKIFCLDGSLSSTCVKPVGFNKLYQASWLYQVWKNQT